MRKIARSCGTKIFDQDRLRNADKRPPLNA